MAISRLAPMRYKNFVWPHNPRTYAIEYGRRMARHDVPRQKRRLEALGMAHRVMRGEGEFFGPEAYDQFKALASVFYEDSPGLLVHPVWQAVNAYFVELALEQEPRRDYVRYSFVFWECGEEERAFGLKEITAVSLPEDKKETEPTVKFHTVVKGDTLWAIAGRYGLGLTQLISLNPEIKNPNLILPGQKVRVA